jgi:putative membrane protein
MGGMMGSSGPMYGWIILWTVIGVALLVGGSVVAGRFLHAHAHGAAPVIRSPEPPKLDEAQAALRQRYARGEISREDYLQAKVELED